MALELPINRGLFPHQEAVLLNSARNCLAYALKANKIKKIYLPRYSCLVILNKIIEFDVEYEFYQLNDRLEVDCNINLQLGDYLLYINYFGLKDDYIKDLFICYGNHLIVDNAQAFYARPIPNIITFYSPRKFFGVPDGGCLYINNYLLDLTQDLSHDKCSHLIKRIDLDASTAYPDYLINENKINGLDIRAMSKFTNKFLFSIDYEVIRKKRWDNFNFLHLKLSEINEFKIDSKCFECPLVYPFLVCSAGLREQLLLNKIYVATYWSDIIPLINNNSFEYRMVNDLLPLPIDQRYDTSDMEIIYRIIHDYLNLL